MAIQTLPRVAFLTRRGAVTKEDLEKAPVPPIEARISGPGPAAYALPSTVGSRGHDASKRFFPSYSFGLKYNGDKSSDTPGPAAYLPKNNRTGQEKSHQYSLAGRTSLMAASVSDCSPGPAKYNPGLPASMRRNPEISLGVKPSSLRLPDTPGPGSYQIPPTIGNGRKIFSSSAAYSISAPHPPQKLPPFPAPNSYGPINIDRCSKKKNPQYSFQGRYKEIKDTENVPGPGAYNQPFRKILRSEPAFSMRKKHSEFIVFPVESMYS